MKKGFTLAEVLITIGLIGIIAAITLPNITSHWRKKTVEARLKKFYSTANQAVMLSEAVNGDKKYWSACGISLANSKSITVLSDCEEWYNLYFKNYLKTIKVLHFTSSNGYQNTAAFFEDGSVFVIKDGYDMYFYPFAKDFDEDTFLTTSDDGTTSRPDCGTKFFAFSFRPWSTNEAESAFYNKGIEPYRFRYCTNGICDTLTREVLLNHYRFGCNTSSPFKSYCTALIQENNWEIPDDYPFKF